VAVINRIRLYSVAILTLLFSGTGWSADPEGSRTAADSPLVRITWDVRPEARAFAEDLVALSHLLVQHHVDAPARQQTILIAARSLYDAKNMHSPHQLARDCSSATDEQLIEILIEACGPTFGRHDSDVAKARTTVAEALSPLLEGGLQLQTVKASLAERQLSENRYVGVGIAATQDEPGRLIVRSVMPGGPMDRAGVPPETVIASIDGWATQGQSMEECVERLRGPEGTSVLLTIRRPHASEDEQLSLKRGVVPRKSLSFEVKDDGQRRIAILRPESLTASLPHEIQRFAESERRLHGVLLDLRGVSGPSHFAVLVADLFLDGGDMGVVIKGSSRRMLRAQPGEAFADVPLAIVVDPQTTNSCQWLVETLKVRRGAQVFGELRDERTVDDESFPLPGGTTVARFATSVLLFDGEDHAARNRIPHRPNAETSEPEAQVKALVTTTAGGDAAEPPTGTFSDLVRSPPNAIRPLSAADPLDAALNHLNSLPLP
jgi:hypothetical protein